MSTLSSGNERKNTDDESIITNCHSLSLALLLFLLLRRRCHRSFGREEKAIITYLYIYIYIHVHLSRKTHQRERTTERQMNEELSISISSVDSKPINILKPFLMQPNHSLRILLI